MNENIKYVALEVAKSGIGRKQFFEWALNHTLYKVDNQTTFNSRMKAIYKEKCPTESLTAIIAIHENKPIAMCLCENSDRSTKLYDNSEHKKIDLNAKIQVVGFLSFFVKERYRKKGIAHKLMELMEVHRMPLVLGQTKENEYNIMVFEAREKALDIINKSKFSYSINCDRHHSSYKLKIDVFAKHMTAILQDNQKSMYYSNSLMLIKKERLSTKYFEEKYINPIRIKELIEMTPFKLQQEETKVVKKIPTLKPRVIS